MRGAELTSLRSPAWAADRRRAAPLAVAAALTSTGVLLAGLVGAPGQAAGAVAPRVTKLSVHAGSTGGGTRVRIGGRNLSHVRWVEFGSTRAHVVATPTATSVVVVSPAHGAGLVDVRVRTADGLTARVAADRFRYRRPPLQISVGTDVGQTFACARNATWARCWDQHIYGELGNGTSSATPSPPVNVEGLGPGVRDISAGVNHACAVTAGHAARCWGWEQSGVLGNGVDDGNAHVATPVGVKGLGSGVRSIVAGDADTCAVTTSGVVKCWGSDLALQLGTNNSSGLDSAVPVAIAGLPSAASVVVGDSFACALTTAGGVYCWGSNGDGELGDGSAPGLESATPVPVHGLAAHVRSLSAGGDTACAVTSAGAAKCWGSNADGVLGDGDTTRSSSDVPVAVKNLRSGQAAVTVGSDATACATSTIGRVRCWGYNYDGTLGDGTENDSSVPVQVKGLTRGAKQVSIGTYAACALTRTGQVECWGYVQLGPLVAETPFTLPWYR